MKYHLIILSSFVTIICNYTLLIYSYNIWKDDEYNEEKRTDFFRLFYLILLSTSSLFVLWIEDVINFNFNKIQSSKIYSYIISTYIILYIVLYLFLSVSVVDEDTCDTFPEYYCQIIFFSLLYNTIYSMIILYCIFLRIKNDNK